MNKPKKLFNEIELRNAILKVHGSIYHRLIELASLNKPPVFICVLNGAMMFFTDLMKQQGECIIDTIRPKSYKDKTQGDIELLLDIQTNIEGRDVFIIDDILDSGKTMNFLIQYLLESTPRSITPVVLFKKWYSNFPNLIYGIELKEEYWLTGYGLDAGDGTQRNLPYILGELHED